MPEPSIKFYWLPHCTTCQKAAKYLESKGHSIAEFRDVKSGPLRREEIEQLAELVGGVEDLFSRRAIKYRSMKLSERELTSEEIIGLMVDEYTFIKRPVLVSNGRAIAGFTPKSYDKFFE